MAGEERDISTPKVLQKRLGNIPFPLGLLAAVGITPDRVPHWWHGTDKHLPDGAASYLMLLAALAHKSRFGLKRERSVPLSWDVNEGLAVQELEASFLDLLLLFAKYSLFTER